MRALCMTSFLGMALSAGVAYGEEPAAGAHDAAHDAAPAAAKPAPFTPSIVPMGEIFAEYSHNLGSGEERIHGFELSRTSVGARARFTPKISGSIMLEGARFGAYSVTVPTYTLDENGELVVGDGTTYVYDRGNNRIQMFVKRAALEFDNVLDSGLKVQAGMITSAFPLYEELIWGYRFVAGAYTDYWRMGHTVDVGMSLAGKPLGGLLDFQLSIVDGEGPRKPNDDQRLQYQARVSVAPLAQNPTLKGLKFAGYFDYGLLDEEGHYRMSSFAAASFEHPMITVYTGLYRIDYHEVVSAGFSSVLSVNPMKNAHVFLRLDLHDYNQEVENDAASLIIAGIGYDLSKTVQLALDAQINTYEDTTRPMDKSLGLHTRLAF